MSITGIARREFVVGLALTPFVLGPIACARSRDLEEMLVELIPDAEAARTVGEEYLRRFPAEWDRARLLRGLTAGREAEWRALAAQDRDALRARLRARLREDFAAGRVVTLKGWVLSETELRLCALAAQRG